MGQIIYWTIIRTAILIPVLWILADHVDRNLWWIITIMGIYGAIIHPAILGYQKFREESGPVLEGTLCSTCKHFDESAVLCTLYDEHPREDYIPCDGEAWEPESR